MCLCVAYLSVNLLAKSLLISLHVVPLCRLVQIEFFFLSFPCDKLATYDTKDDLEVVRKVMKPHSQIYTNQIDNGEWD